MSQAVLIVDDSVTGRADLARAFERAGFEAHTCASVREAREALERERVDLVVLDDVLPEGEGVALVDALRSDRVDAPPVLVLREPGSEPSRRGATGYVLKPYEAADVVARGRALVSASERPPAPAGRETPDAPRRASRVLAIGAHDAGADSVGEKLERDGTRFTRVASVDEALVRLATIPVDCVLLRLGRDDGPEACRELRARPEGAQVPLVVLGHTSEPEATSRSLAAGADDYVPETEAAEVLAAKLHAHVRRKRMHDEALGEAEARAAAELENVRGRLLAELERRDREIAAFTYSVSHDLKAPIRAITGFAQALVEDFGESLEPHAVEFLERIRGAAHRLSDLLDDLLELSRVERVPLRRERVDVSAIARSVVAALRRRDPERHVTAIIEPGLEADADPALVRSIVEKLLDNAWKFTGKNAEATIEVGRSRDGFYVRDDGVGFDPAHASKLFAPFQRLHRTSEFPGTGIGLSIVQRAIERHGGHVAGDARPGAGATFSFTLPPR